ncbi:MAG: hypothetical protein GWN86_24550 [Desulfobacterales bacterium]|nr:hypothetical protein [Desulfobacterales bacterium]
MKTYTKINSGYLCDCGTLHMTEEKARNCKRAKGKREEAERYSEECRRNREALGIK